MKLPLKLPLAVAVGLGFAPYAAFSIAARAGFPDTGLWIAFFAACLIAALDWAANRAVKLLAIGAVAIFAVLIGFSIITGWTWTFMTIRLAVDSGLFLVIAGSLAVGQPFTLQYARDRSPETIWRSPRFIAINNRITCGWAVAFLILIVAHAANVAGLGLSVRGDLILSLATLAAAVLFSVRYPVYARKASVPAAEAP